MMTTILLVEDNALNRNMLSRRLEKMGYHVILAENGQEGVDMTISEKPDLVLMDINMPVMDGWQASKILRSNLQTQSIPIIALTAHTLTSDRDKAEKIGFNGFAAKPIDFPELINTIETWVSGKNTQ